MRLYVLVALYLLAGFISSWVFAASLAAAGPTCTVGTGGETYGRIQEAVDDPGCATIEIAPGTYHENVSIERSVSIRGAGKTTTIVDGDLRDIVFKIGLSNTGPRPTRVSISDLLIQNGTADLVLGAGGLYGSTDFLSLARVGFYNNHPAALAAWGSTTVSDSFFHSNSNGSGAAIVSNSSLTVSDSYFFANNASGCGGAISTSGPLRIVGSTFNNNSVWQGDGGAICVTSASVVPPSVSIVNSTFTGNQAAGSSGSIPPRGGAIFAHSVTLTVTNSTIAGNTVVDTDGRGGGLFLAGGVSTLKNTIVSGNSAAFGGNCDSDAPLAIDGGHNLDSGITCGFSSAYGSLSNAAANLGPLAKNGGKTVTMKLLAGSAAINAGDHSICTSEPVNNLDQRGYLRVTGSDPFCDMGAYELYSPGPPHLYYLPVVLR